MDFYGREDILEILDHVADGNQFLFNLFGEPGIGKTTLLYEVKRRLEDRQAHSRVVLIDFKTLKDAEQPSLVLLREIYQGVHGKAPGRWGDLRKETDRTINLLNQKGPFVLMFDSTEVLQDIQKFWDWLAEQFLVPLQGSDKVRLVIVGRIAAPLSHYRIHFSRLPIQVLGFKRAPDDPAGKMIGDRLSTLRSKLPSEEMMMIREAICDLTLGHPGMVRQMVDYASLHYQKGALEHFKLAFCNTILINKTRYELLDGISDPWKDILFWASPLKELDEEFLRRYLELVAPELVDYVSSKPGPKTNVIPWFSHTHEMGIRAIARKQGFTKLVIVSESIRHFLYLSLMYQSLQEKECPSILRAYDAVIEACSRLSKETAYAADSSIGFLQLLEMYQEDRCNACKEMILILHRLAEECRQDPQAYAGYIAQAKFFEVEMKQHCSGTHREVDL